MKSLINKDGKPFSSSTLKILRSKLDALADEKRTEYRNQNALNIAENEDVRFLIVSGPGTGKSYLFLKKIDYWFRQDAQAKVFVTSFVRKLVTDLQNDIEGDIQLTDEQKRNITAVTLHKFSRSIVEKNHGSANWRFRPHFQIIDQYWKDVVWDDVLDFYQIVHSNYPLEIFEEQLHNNHFEESDKWPDLKIKYFELCKFYNAAGFADLILRAKDALTENVHLNNNNYFIVDEYQDFNAAEDALINELVNNPKGLLIVGDDEQVLYEKLKSGKPTLIRNLYKNNNYLKGMLPFCSRSSSHITKAAGHFVQRNREAECIEKIYLPLKADDEHEKVQIIACATPNTAVDYIKKFVEDNKEVIDQRKTKLAEGEEKDAFLIILTPTKNIGFYGKSKEVINDIVSSYQVEACHFSDDYYKVLNYYSLAENPQNNFTFRKVLKYENHEKKIVHELIETAMKSNQNFCELEDGKIKNAIHKCNDIRDILISDGTIEQKIEKIADKILLADKTRLKEEIERKPISQEKVTEVEHQGEEEAELEEIGLKKMGAVELMTITGSKGLSADHVIIIGFDNVNMNLITKNAFYVSMTRARQSLHILTALKSGGSKEAHQFMNDLPDDHVEYFKYTKKDRKKIPLRGRQELKDYFTKINSF